jgi:NAD(P)-dependent dehydrogenase (short-subunit alcohol dehydrogenase family)
MAINIYSAIECYQTYKGSVMGLLEGKVALVTGGTSGIGRASAVLFAQEGAKVVLTGRRAAQGKAVAAEIEAAGGDALFIQADLAEIGGIPAIIDKAVERYGRLDCAFNNAGVSGGGPLETLDEPLWDKIIDTNLQRQQGRHRLPCACSGGGTRIVRHPCKFHQPVDHP